MNKLIDNAHVNPIVVFDDSDPDNIVFGNVDDTAIKLTLLAMLYRPYDLASDYLEGLAALEQGNGSYIYSISPEKSYADLLSNSSSSSAQSSSQPYVADAGEIQTAIACGDIVNAGATTLQELQEAYDEMLSISEERAGIWLPVFTGACS